MPAPYYITDQHPDCPSRWAVVNSAGNLEACHDTKNSAIAQMVAISIGTNSDPGGQWPKTKPLHSNK